MIPGGTTNFTAAPVQATFLSPLDRPYQSLTYSCMGGPALNDGSQGRRVKEWIATYASGVISVKPIDGPIAYTHAVAEAVKTICLAFDNNMNPNLCWQTVDGKSILYYYNTTTSSYSTLTVSGTTSCRVSVDDGRLTTVGNSDVIFAYTTGTQLKYRQQRDRYLTEYVVGNTTKRLIRLGMSSGNRLQFECK